MKKYFFTPRVGKDYEKGFHGIKTLILGSHFYCPYTDCSHLKEECASSNTICIIRKSKCSRISKRKVHFTKRKV